MKKITIALCALLLLGIFGACSSGGETSFYAMDTVVTIKCEGDQKAVKEARKLIQGLSDQFDRFSKDSDIYFINYWGSTTVGNDTINCLNDAYSVWMRTGGLFDITVAPLVDLWGFPGDKPAVPDNAELEQALKLVGGGSVKIEENKVTLMKQGMELDLGGIAKGYATNKVSEIFDKMDVGSAIVSIGGNVLAWGSRPTGEAWRVAVRDPLDPTMYIGTLSVKNRHIITSGGYERYFVENGREYVHILDPRTGMSADSGLKSVTIVSEDGALGDGLSTALYIMGEEGAIEHWRRYRDFEMILVTDDRRVLITGGLSFEPSSEGYSYEAITD
ncbi:MAG: FAD:protein FMN transferase [Oscillospiraceae bacterium]|jgi:thiamine biosynthesis lipoprotein